MTSFLQPDYQATVGGSMDRREEPFFSSRGQWLDGANGGFFALTVDGATIANEGMFDDATEGRVFEIVGSGFLVPKLQISFTMPSYLIGSQVGMSIRTYCDTIQANLSVRPLSLLVGTMPQMSTPGQNYSGSLAPFFPNNAWNTTYLLGLVDNVNPTVIGSQFPAATPAPTSTVKLRIASIYVSIGREVPYLFGGGTAAKPITWRSSAAPTYGSYYIGDTVTNSVPTAGQPKGWVCTTAGSPGVWTSLGNL